MMLKHLLCCVVALLAVVSVSAEFYDPASGVVNLDSSNFDKIVKKEGQVTLVEFYAPWCGHCQHLKPEWIKAAKQLKGVVTIAAIDCDAERNKPVAGQYGIRGFPTIKAFVGKGAPVDYNGERTASAIVEWAKGLLPETNVKKITAKSEAKFLDGVKQKSGILLFTDKKETPALFKALALKLGSYFNFGLVQNSEKELVKKYKVDKFPSILMFPKNGDAPIFYIGKLQVKPLTKWMTRGLENYVSDEPNTQPPELADQSCLKVHCIDQGGLCAMLLASGDQKATGNLDVLEEVQEERGDSLVHFSWVDVSTEAHALWMDKAFGLQVQDYPQLVVVSPKKGKFASFIGTYSAENVADFIKGVLSGRVKSANILSGSLPTLETDSEKCKPLKKPEPEKKPEPKQQQQQQQQHQQRSGPASSQAPPANFQTVLTADNFDKLVLNSNAPWMVEFFAPWCGHCKSLAPEWKKAAETTKNMVRFGTVDCTVEEQLAQRFGIKGFPTIKVFPAGVKTLSKVIDYQGPRQAKAISDFAFKLLSGVQIQKLTAGTFGEWFTTFKPEQRRVLLVTNKPSDAKQPDLFKSLALEFGDRLAFGIIHEEEEALIKQFQVTKFPTILVLDAAKNVKPEVGIQAHKYDGQPSFNPLWAFLNPLAGQATTTDDLGKDAVPTVHFLKSNEDFEKACLSRGGLCLVALIGPDSLAANGEPKYEKILDEVATKHIKKPIHFMKADRFHQPKFVNEFGLSDSDVASVVILNPRKKQFAPFLGAFDEEHLSEFIEGVLSGKTRTSKIGAIPKLETVPATEQAKPAEGGADANAAPCSGSAESGTCSPKHNEL